MALAPKTLPHSKTRGSWASTKAPSVVVLENVPGVLTVNGGRDYQAVASELTALGYRTGHICLNASSFVPQSRSRVFLLGYRDVPPPLLPRPPDRHDGRLTDIVRNDLEWWGARQMACFLGSLSDLQASRVDGYQRQDEATCHGAYRRTRKGVAVWEVRDDEIAGGLAHHCWRFRPTSRPPSRPG